MVPKRTLWAVDRHTLNMLVQNKIARYLPSTKSGDLYYEQKEVAIGSSSCFLSAKSEHSGKSANQVILPILANSGNQVRKNAELGKKNTLSKIAASSPTSSGFFEVVLLNKYEIGIGQYRAISLKFQVNFVFLACMFQKIKQISQHNFL